MIIVRQEEGDLRWATVKRRLRLNAPHDPKTGEIRRKLWLWVIPFIIAIIAYEIALKPYVDDLWVSILPFFAEPSGYSVAAVFESEEILNRLVGAWWFFGLYVVNAVFNTILGEEFLFRGVLLPKMEGVFGRWSWVANGVLHGCYHFHQPWGILASVISGVFLYAFPSWRFRRSGAVRRLPAQRARTMTVVRYGIRRPAKNDSPKASSQGQRPPLQFFVWILAQSVILAWLYNSTDGSLPMVIIGHAAINTAGRFMLPEFTGETYQAVWWFMAGLYVVTAVIVTLLGGTKRLATSIPRRPTAEHDDIGER